MAALSPLREQRRDKILTVAEVLFARDGYRATTIEGLAAAVGMSKVTVYRYFKDKDAVFAAVAERVAMRLQQVFAEGLQVKGGLRDRVATALIEKHKVVHDLVRNSTHAADLFRAKDRMSGETFRDVDDQMVAVLAKELEGVGKRPAALAKMLFDASQGIANGASDFRAVENGIRQLVTLIDPHAQDSD